MSFTIIDDSLFEQGLDGTEVLVYSKIARILEYNEKNKKHYLPSQEDIGKSLNYSRSTVVRAINSLKEKGFLDFQRKTIDGRIVTVYKILRKIEKTAKKDLIPTEKNCIINNNEHSNEQSFQKLLGDLNKITRNE